MAAMKLYRDERLPFLEWKECDSIEGSFKKHFHEEWSFGLIERGSTRVWMDGRATNANAGQVVCIPSLRPHACHPDDPAAWKYGMLFVHPDWLGSSPATFNPALPALPEPSLNLLGSRLLKRIGFLFRQGGSPLEIESAVLELMRELGALIDQEDGQAAFPDDASALIAALDYLREHYSETVTLDTLAGVAGLSKFHLTRSFARRFRISPHAYQNALRVNDAKKRLARREPIAEVAAEAGFCDQSHFTRVFSSHVGATPREYARSMRV